MRKLKLNKLNLSLNLKALTTPLLALSLTLGYMGLFGGSVGAASVTVNTDSIPVSSRQLLFDDGNYSPGVFQTLNTSSNGVVVQQNSAVEGTIASFGYDMPSLTECSNSRVLNISWSYTLSFKSFSGGSDANDFGLTNTLTLKNEPVLIGGYMASLNTPNPGVNIFPISSASTLGGGMSVTASTGIAVFESINGPSQDFSGEQITVQADLSNLQDPMLISELPNLMIAMGLRSEYGGGSIEWNFSRPSLQITYDNSSCPQNTVPTISPFAVTIPSATASGSTVVLGSNLTANDADGDKLTYSITAGNTGKYFDIDSSTGNITTTNSNIPAGTYKLSVQVDDGKDGKTTAEVVIVVAASESGKGSGSDSTGTPSSTSSLVKAPKTGAVLMSLMLVPILIGGLAYLYVAQHNKISIKKKSER
jgi:hypothetical protein